MKLFFRSLLFTTALSLPIATSSAAQAVTTDMPDSLVTAAVAAINAASDSARASFASRNLRADMPAAARREVVELLNDIHRESGGVTLAATQRVGRGFFLTLRAKQAPRLALLHLGGARDNPTILSTVEVLKAWNPAIDSIRWPTEKLSSERAVVKTISTRLDALSRAGAFSGAVLIGKGERILFQRGYGFANLEDSVRNSPKTHITIASIGKMFTATAIAQLISEGRLHWDDTLGTVLPEYPSAERKASITVRQLLGHTAGLGDLFDDPAYSARTDSSSPLTIAGLVASRPLLFPPGTKWSYSNEGYVVLGAIIEKISGESYDSYLQRHVFAPAGMTHTGNFGADEIVPWRAVGYRHHANDPLNIAEPYGNRTFVKKGGAAGGAYTTVGDLWKFTKALRAGALLPPAIRDTLWVGRSPLPWDKTQSYGYGAMVSAVNGRATIGHGGGGSGSGIDNDIRFFRDGSYTVIVLANMDPPAAADLSKALVEFLARQ